MKFTLSERQLQVRHYGSAVHTSRREEHLPDRPKLEEGRYGAWTLRYRLQIGLCLHGSPGDSFGRRGFFWSRILFGLELPNRWRGDVDETLIILPLKEAGAVQRDRAMVLESWGHEHSCSFARSRRVTWSSEGGLEGLYMRTKPEWLDDTVRRVSLLGEQGDRQTDERWLIFSREVRQADRAIGHVEVAFKVEAAEAWWQRESFPASRSRP